jgi:hypothetical protein
MELDAEKSAVLTTRRCQRNWDVSSTIPEEHIQHWIYMAMNAPSKQDLGHYNLYVITDAGLINTLFEHSWGCTTKLSPTGEIIDGHVAMQFEMPGHDVVWPRPLTAADFIYGRTRNSQVKGNLCLLMCRKVPLNHRGIKPDSTLRALNDADVRDQGFVSCGIALGQISLSAANLGYSTGYNTCFGTGDQAKQKVKDLLGVAENEHLLHSLTIGLPQPNRPHEESDDNIIEIYEDGVYKQIQLGRVPFTYQGRSYVVVNDRVRYSTYSHTDKDIAIHRF